MASFIDALHGTDAAFEVIVGQGRLLTTKTDIATGEGTAVIAVGDPTVVAFEVLPNPRMIRVLGRRAGVTDLSITTAAGQTYSFEIHVVYDLELLRAQLRQLFPDAYLKLAQLREHVVVEGEARSPAQVSQILQTIEAYLESVQVPHAVEGRQAPTTPGARGEAPPPRRQPGRPSRGAGESDRPEPSPSDVPTQEKPREPGELAGEAAPESGAGVSTRATFAKPQIINLLRVPGVHQVLLKVRIAELNRSGLREIGADVLGVDSGTGNIFGASIAGATVEALATLGLGGLTGNTATRNGPSGTAFGIFPSGDFEVLLRALRQNSLLRILAEPNLVALSGHEASFLAGGEFPRPVIQGGFGGLNAITIEDKPFGVQLTFVPYVLDDETIRVSVTPEVSSIDEALGTTLTPGGQVTPGLNSRRAHTTVELREGQTLAIAGLLQIEIDGRTSRIPGLGDLPYIGPMFSNTSHERVEKELLVLVTPYLVRPMTEEQVPPLPGEEVNGPNDLEFYLLNRIEGRTGRDFRSTTKWDDPWHLVRFMNLERRWVSGPVGLSD